MPQKDRILFVDDDGAMRDLAKKSLEKRGYEVGVAHDRMEAMEKLDELCPDVAILDLRLPRGQGVPSKNEGIELLRLILRNYDLPVVMLTIVDDPEIEEIILEEGAIDYVVKEHTDMRRIANRIKNLLNLYPRSVRFLSTIDQKVCLDTKEKEVHIGLTTLDFKKKLSRYKLLHYLMLNSEDFIPARELIKVVWNKELPEISCQKRENLLGNLSTAISRLEHDLVGYIERDNGDSRFKERVGTKLCKKIRK